jgi:hypothetical protein
MSMLALGDMRPCGEHRRSELSGMVAMRDCWRDPCRNHPAVIRHKRTRGARGTSALDLPMPHGGNRLRSLFVFFSRS